MGPLDRRAGPVGGPSRYCLERLLYRLGASDRRGRFVLKGAMLLPLVGSPLSGDARPRSASARRRLARCGNARLNLQIDMGLGDAVWPSPQARTYPALLDFPSPDVLVYPREAVVAEKL